MKNIYKITNVSNGKVYIGQTKYAISKRFNEHKNDSKKSKLQKNTI